MARPNYEAQFKQKLQDRELKPSADSWEKLSGRMEQEGEKKTSSQYKWWVGIAAAFVAGLLVMNLFFSAPAGQSTPAYVEESKEVQEDVETRAGEKLLREAGEGAQYVSQEENVDNNTPAEKLGAAEKSLAGEEEVEPVHNSEEERYASAGEESKSFGSERSDSGLDTPDESSNGSKPNLAGKPNSAVAEAGRGVQQEPNEDKWGAGDIGPFNELAIDEELLSQKLQEVVAEANVMEAAAGEISDAEINALLLAASTEIERDQEVAIERLSADELLYEVEMELEESFRAKVFELLREGLRKTRTAVANIND